MNIYEKIIEIETSRAAEIGYFFHISDIFIYRISNIMIENIILIIITNNIK